MKVDFSVLSRQFAMFQNEYEEAALRSLRSGWYILGKELARFERDFANYHGVCFCSGVGNGLDALRLSLMALGIGKEDEVIVQANTYIASALAITETGATPVFVDTDCFYGINTSSLANMITEKTKAIIVVHLYGQPCDMDSIIKIANRYGLHIIEDCAQAHGAKYKGRRVGTMGVCGCYSFYPTKPIGAFGDAGAVITNDEGLDERIRMLRNYGSKEKYKHEVLGINSRMDEIQAALTGVSLHHADENNEERRRIASEYICGIKNDKILLPRIREGCEHVFHVFAIICEDRDSLQKFMAENGISTQIHYPVPCHLAECYSSFSWKAGTIPLAESYSRNELSLPLFIGMTEEEVSHVIETVNRF